MEHVKIDLHIHLQLSDTQERLVKSLITYIERKNMTTSAQNLKDAVAQAAQDLATLAAAVAAGSPGVTITPTDADAILASLQDLDAAIKKIVVGGVIPVPTPTGVPVAPVAVTAGAVPGSVTISWPDVQGATSYNLYTSPSTGVTPSNGTLEVGVTSPHTETVATGASIFAVVTAVNASGEGVASAEVTATAA